VGLGEMVSKHGEYTRGGGSPLCGFCPLVSQVPFFIGFIMNTIAT